MTDRVPENFISLQQVVHAAFARGYIVGFQGSCDITPLVGELTGLTMAKYELVQNINLHGWDIVRRADA